MSGRFKRGLWILAVLVALLLVAAGLFQLSKARDFQLFGKLVSHQETTEKVVALTFDDAPTEYVDEVLQVLKTKKVSATFYMIGGAMEKYPELTRQIVEQGHELGNHSYSHPRFYFKSPSFIKNEIETTDALIRKAGYSGEITFRPPYGKKLVGLPWYLSRHNRTSVTWDVEPDTYHEGDAEAIADLVLREAKPGSIILLHPFCERVCAADRQALPVIIDGLRERGFELVTISQLLGK